MSSVLTITDLVRTGTAATLTVGIMGPPGPAGAPGPVTITRVAAEALGGHRIVRLNAGGQAAYADCTTLADASAVIGITTGAAAQGEDAVIQTEGELIEPSWDWAIDAPVFLSTQGQLTQTAPLSGFTLCVGVPLSSNRLLIRVGEPIIAE